MSREGEDAENERGRRISSFTPDLTPGNYPVPATDGGNQPISDLTPEAQIDTSANLPSSLLARMKVTTKGKGKRKAPQGLSAAKRLKPPAVVGLGRIEGDSRNLAPVTSYGVSRPDGARSAVGMQSSAATEHVVVQPMLGTTSASASVLEAGDWESAAMHRLASVFGTDAAHNILRVLMHSASHPAGRVGVSAFGGAANVSNGLSGLIGGASTGTGASPVNLSIRVQTPHPAGAALTGSDAGPGLASDFGVAVDQNFLAAGTVGTDGATAHTGDVVGSALGSAPAYQNEAGIAIASSTSATGGASAWGGAAHRVGAARVANAAVHDTAGTSRGPAALNQFQNLNMGFVSGSGGRTDYDQSNIGNRPNATFASPNILGNRGATSSNQGSRPFGDLNNTLACLLGTDKDAPTVNLAGLLDANAGGVGPGLMDLSAQLLDAAIGMETEAPRPQYLVFPGDTPTLANVPLRDRKRIWSKQYFDLRKLRRTGKKEETELTIAQKLGRSVLKAKESDKKEICNFDEWLELFLRYVSVYGHRFPGEVASMINYTESVRTLANNFLAFRIYDENFRYWRFFHREWPWDRVQNDLWCLASVARVTSTSDVTSSTPETDLPQVQTRPDGSRRAAVNTCHRYNANFPCTGYCRFAHKCTYCKGDHGLVNCERLRASNSSESDDTSAGPSK